MSGCFDLIFCSKSFAVISGKRSAATTWRLAVGDFSRPILAVSKASTPQLGLAAKVDADVLFLHTINKLPLGIWVMFTSSLDGEIRATS